MDDVIVARLRIANLPEETRAATLQSVALGVEVRLHGQAAVALSEKQMEILKSKSLQSPEVTHEWLKGQSPKLAKLYEQELQAYLAEKTTQPE